MEKIELLCDSHHGIYLPSIWCSNTDNIWNIKQVDWDYIADSNNISNDDYFEIWFDILSDAAYTDSNGVVWTLFQDEDLFAMTADEKAILFGV